MLVLPSIDIGVLKTSGADPENNIHADCQRPLYSGSGELMMNEESKVEHSHVVSFLGISIRRKLKWTKQIYHSFQDRFIVFAICYFFVIVKP